MKVFNSWPELKANLYDCSWAIRLIEEYNVQERIIPYLEYMFDGQITDQTPGLNEFMKYEFEVDDLVENNYRKKY